MFQNSKVGFPRELTRIEVLLEQEEAEVEKPIQWMHLLTLPMTLANV